jgi:CRP/FNR family transcriptional regulator
MSVQSLLQRTPSLAGATPEDIERMASQASVRTLKRGAFLWRAGDTPRNLTVIRSGLIKLSRTSGNGRTHLCGLFGAPESIGDLVLLRGAPYPASAIVATGTACVVTMPRELVLEAIARRPELVESLTCGIHKKLLALHDNIEILGAGSVDARLATALLKLHSEFGDDLEDGSSIIAVALSRRELAELVSTSFETAIRTMSRWEHEGVVATHPNGFTLYDKARLEAVAGLPVESAGATGLLSVGGREA